MVAQPVEAVWVWSYNVSAQKATYGRFGDDTSYTKDYLQASGTNANLLDSVFPRPTGASQSDITYRWVGGQASGFLKAPNDRQHVSWSTAVGAPPPWRLTLSPSSAGPGTIPGNPNATSAAGATVELAAFAASGISAFLIGLKVAGDPGTMHIRAYVSNPPPTLRFADTALLPPGVLRLIAAIRPTRACQSALFGAGTPSGQAYFDPNKNHDAWSTVPALSPVAAAPAPSPGVSPRLATASTAAPLSDDGAAEAAPFNQAMVDLITSNMQAGNYAVPDAIGTMKTRGSSQQVFAKAVKSNYGWQCAITGIRTRAFLVASHIVPWADDKQIRTDPSNGICLSTLVDRAFDAGFLTIGVDRVVHVDANRVAADPALMAALLPYDGQALRLPVQAPPNPSYLARRLASPLR